MHFNESKIWAMKNGSGKLYFIYAAGFKGTDLIELKPKEFSIQRFNNFHQSLDNPAIFSKFFELALPEEAKRSYNDVEEIDNIINNLVKVEAPSLQVVSRRASEIEADDPDFFVNTKFGSVNNSSEFLLASKAPNKSAFIFIRSPGATTSRDNLNSDLTSKMNESGLNITKNNEINVSLNRLDDKLQKQTNSDNPKKNVFISKQSSRLEEEENKKGQQEKRAATDFQYTSLEIFFKADTLIYEQDKNTKIEDYDPENPNEIWQIAHFFTFSGWKLLITFHLKRLLKNLEIKQKPQDISRLYEQQKEKEDMETKNSPPPNNKMGTDEINLFEINRQNSTNQKIIKDYENNQQNTSFQRENIPKQKKIIKYIFNVHQPQFNLHYTRRRSQMILTSRRNCMIIFWHTLLPYDVFKQDLKFSYKVCFRDLECFTAPRSYEHGETSYWISYDSQNIKSRGFIQREGPLLRVINCNRAIFEYSYFNLSECKIDFSKPLFSQGTRSHFSNENAFNRATQNIGRESRRTVVILQNPALMWKNEPRIDSLLIDVDVWTSYMDRESFVVFRDIMDFIIILISSNKMKQQELELYNQKLEELKHVGKNNMQKYLRKKVAEAKIVTQRKSKVEYSIKTGSLKLTKDDSPFINFKLEDFIGTHVIFADDSNDYQLKIKEIEIENLYEENTDYHLILKKFPPAANDDLNEDMIEFTSNVFFVPGIANTSHKWKVNKKYEFKVCPLVIKLTEEIYHKFYSWAFQEEKTNEKADKTVASEPKKEEKVHISSF